MLERNNELKMDLSEAISKESSERKQKITEIHTKHLYRNDEGIGNSIHCEFKTHIDYSLEKIPNCEKGIDKNKEEIS